MCCTPRRPHMGGHVGCCMPLHHMPFMWTKRRMIKTLEEHLGELRDQVKDIEEELAELKKEQ